MNQSIPNKLRVRSALRACGAAFAGIGLFSMIINVLMLTGPLFMLQIYDRVLSSYSVPTLLAFAALALALFIFMGILEYIRSKILVRVGSRLNEQLSGFSFESAVLLPLKMGRRAEKLNPVQELDQVRQFIAGPGPLAVFDVPWMPIYIAVIFLFHPALGYFAIAGAVILVILVLANEFMLRKPMAALAQASRTRSGMIEASRRNGEVMMSMGLLNNMLARWADRETEFAKAQLSSGDRLAFFSSVTKTFRFILQSGILGFAAYFVLQGEISPGIMIAASIILSRALSPIEQAVAHWRPMVNARMSYRRLKDALASMPDREQRTELESPSKTLMAKNVIVVAPGDNSICVQGVNIELQAGDGLGIIGPSASGKTSFVRALVGVWPVARGEIRLDGARLDQWNPEALAKAIAYLPQDVELFEGTVAENISRFSGERDDEKIVAAAKLANVHDMILALPEGYETHVGEQGAVLSAGQRQRVGLARTLYGQPFMIVLDEPNSNLDAAGEEALNQAITHERERGAIVIVVAHRPSAIVSLNKLLMLSGGQQTAFGPKEDVLAQVSNPPKGGLKVVGDKS